MIYADRKEKFREPISGEVNCFTHVQAVCTATLPDWVLVDENIPCDVCAWEAANG